MNVGPLRGPPPAAEPPPARVLVFAKLPTPGRVKTRLAPLLGMDGAAQLARAMLLDTMQLCRRWHVTWAFDPAHERARAKEVVRAAGIDPERVRLVPQQGDGFGARLQRAIDDARTRPCRLAIVGGDSPQLGESGVRGIHDALSSHDVVLGPSAGGGVYALGQGAGVVLDLREAFVPGEETKRIRQAAEDAGLSVFELDAGYDVDVLEDLEKLARAAMKAENNAMGFTRVALAELNFAKASPKG